MQKDTATDRPFFLALVVDDENEERRSLSTFLRAAGWRVHEAADGRLAIAALRDIDPHLVITDLAMPNLDGLELTMFLRLHRPEVKLIAISGTFDNSILDAARHLGAHQTLRKPISVASLRTAMKAVGLPLEFGRNQ